jgi:3D (Asp-Asp-Asp) domain-containing protein
LSIAVTLYTTIVLLGPAEVTDNPLASLNSHYEETSLEIHKKARQDDIEAIVADRKAQEAQEARRQAEEAAARAKAQQEAEALREAHSNAKREAESDGVVDVSSNGSSDSSGRRMVRSGNHEGAGLNVEATYYTALCDTGCTGVTATGIDVRQSIYHDGLRIIAVDPAVIPLGSVVEVIAGGQAFKALAGDTGGAIKGNRIDILVGTKEEARNLGRTSASVRILNEG